jgi:hypothetical protein
MLNQSRKPAQPRGTLVRVREASVGFSADTDDCECPMKAILFDHSKAGENNVFDLGLRARSSTSDDAKKATRGLRGMQIGTKRSSVAIDFRSTGNDLVSWIHDREKFFKSFAGAGRLNLHESNSGNLLREIGQAITALQSPAQLSLKRRMEGVSTPSVCTISTIRKTSRKVAVFPPVILREIFFGGPNAPFFPRGFSHNTRSAQGHVNACSIVGVSVHGGDVNCRNKGLHERMCALPLK